MDEYTLLQYRRGLVSPEMRRYIEEELEAERAEWLYEEGILGCSEYEDWYSENPTTDEEIDAWEDEQFKKKLFISRDEKGRLNKGSTIARKRNCDEEDIWCLYNTGKCTVKEIVMLRGCSKSTVYNVIKKYKKKEKDI